MKKWLSRLAKIAFFFLALFAILITVLFNMGGNSDTLKGAIEQYIGQATGYAAQIQSFNKMTFFPNIALDMENIILKKPNKTALEAWSKAEAEKPPEEQGIIPPPINFTNFDASIEAFKIKIGFWDVGLGNTRKIKDIQIRNAVFKANVLARKALTIETLGIDETADGIPFMNIEGTLGKEKFTATIDLEAQGKKKNRKYFLGEESAFEAKIGTLSLSGVLRPRSLGGMHLRDVVFRHNDLEFLSATFSLIRRKSSLWDVKGDFKTPQDSSIGTFDWEFTKQAEAMLINGAVETEKLASADFKSASRLSNAWKAWNTLIGKPDNIEESLAHNITITADNMDGQAFEGMLQINSNTITFEK